ncbi:hypothetical protein PPGU19_075280 (plasmid) [Paraburkholderia sp. PGU19]|nr:hypothetical protein PPGU19_075280 [Paraburkholderia sp. PGU19]
MVNGLSKAAQFVVAPEPRQENGNATLEVKQGPKGKQVSSASGIARASVGIGTVIDQKNARPEP